MNPVFPHVPRLNASVVSTVELTLRIYGLQHSTADLTLNIQSTYSKCSKLLAETCCASKEMCYNNVSVTKINKLEEELRVKKQILSCVLVLALAMTGLPFLNIQVSAAENEELYWVTVAAGYYHSAAIRSDGTLWAWGLNGNGQLGDGTTTNSSTPVQIGSDTNWASVAAGFNYTMAIRTDGTLWGWGHNAFGRLGDSSTTRRTSPVPIGTCEFNVIAGGWHFSAAIQADGSLWAWGRNNYYQIGDGTHEYRLSPVRISDLARTLDDSQP